VPETVNQISIKFVITNPYQNLQVSIILALMDQILSILYMEINRILSILWHVGFVVGKAALGQVFSEYFGFPCQSFHQFLHHHNHPGLAE
jgi:hypothetical protein